MLVRCADGSFGCQGYGQVVALRSGAAQQLIDPAVSSALVALREQLVRSAQSDRINACKEPELFHPFSPLITCMGTHARDARSDFRVALRGRFGYFASTGDKKKADQLVPLVERMITLDAKLTPEQVRAIVWNDYRSAFGTSPIAIAPTRFPTKVTATPTPTPLPSTSTRFRLPGGGAVVTDAEQDIDFVPEVGNGKPNYLLYAGIGVAVLGVGYLAMRGRS